MLIAWISRKDFLIKGVWAFTLFGFFLHVYGFSVRIYLAGRPPVSNMYETVVWVAFGAVLFSMILESIYKYRFIIFAGTLVGLFALVIADSAPAVLDPSLQPLEAVLRSNYWLIIHVMPITISYAAFFLAFFLAAYSAGLPEPSALSSQLQLLPRCRCETRGAYYVGCCSSNKPSFGQ